MQKETTIGDVQSTIESHFQYSGMKDTNQSFLWFSGWYPNPDDKTSSMLCMAFVYQCLIVMVYDHMWSAYVTVMYILMTRKCEAWEQGGI